MASYVQLGRGWRPNYEAAPVRRRRAGGRGVAVTVVLAAAVFAAGLLVGRHDGGPSQLQPTSPQPMQFYPG
jgi:hypothetical protein